MGKFLGVLAAGMVLSSYHVVMAPALDSTGNGASLLGFFVAIGLANVAYFVVKSLLADDPGESPTDEARREEDSRSRERADQDRT